MNETFDTPSNKFNFVVYTSLLGSGLFTKEGTVKIQRMNSFFRDLILRLVKATVKDFLSQISHGEVHLKPIQVVTAIEDYIAFRQALEFNGLKDIKVRNAID